MNLNKGKIIMISVISALGLIFLSGGVIFVVWKRKRSRSYETESSYIQMEDITARTPIVRAPSDHFDAYNEGINHGEEDSEWAQQVKIKRCGKGIALRNSI